MGCRCDRGVQRCLFFATVMIDKMADEIGQEPPLNVMLNMMYVMNNLKSDRREPEKESGRQWRCELGKEG